MYSTKTFSQFPFSFSEITPEQRKWIVKDVIQLVRDMADGNLITEDLIDSYLSLLFHQASDAIISQGSFEAIAQKGIFNTS